MQVRTAAAAFALRAADDRRRGEGAVLQGQAADLMINFAAGGPADIEGRIFARHLRRHIDGPPNIIIQNLRRRRRPCRHQLSRRGRAARRHRGGYLTAAAWNYVIDPAAYRIDFRTFEFIALPARQHRLLRAHRHAARHEGPARHRSRRTGLVAGGLAAELLEGPADPALARHARRAVQIRHRLPQRRAGAACAAARRDQLLFGVVAELFRLDRAELVKTGEAIPVWYDPVYDGRTFAPFKPMDDQRSRASRSSIARSKARRRRG